MDGELNGTVALVTGAARNIGADIVRAFAASGAAVVINAKSSAVEANALAAEIGANGGSAIAVLADITIPDEVARLVRETIAAFGRLDILVNNAAVRDEAPFGELTYAHWKSVLSIVLDGAFLCTQTALPHLKAGGRGVVINMGGLTAHTGAKNRAHVVTAKAGIVGLTRALAHDLSGDGVTVNCIVPGLIDTVRPGAEPNHHKGRTTLVGRYGTTGDVASAAGFLAGPGARYITGQTIHINGGLYLGN